jgi:signal transduction histidine kinase
MLSRPELEARVRSLVAEPWRRHRRRLLAADVAGLALGAAVLWATGYPAWRSGTLLVAAAALGVLQALRHPRSREGVGGRGALASWGELAAVLGAVASTGGGRSPLLAGVLAAMPLSGLRFGWSARTKLLWAATAVGLSGIALLPPGWVGPAPASEAYWAISAGGAAVGVVATVLYLGLLSRVAHDCLRDARLAREELTVQAIARARDLEQLGARLSHELRNPLSAIKTLVQISVPATEDPELRERLEVIEGEVRRMQQILQEYLTFSRPLENLRREEVDLAALVEDVLALLAGRAAAAGVELCRQGRARVEADPLRLKEALLNLIVNALEASPAGSRVDVEIDGEAEPIRVRIVDRGRGMPEDVLAQIGIPFFTTREEGTGLGVALARATFVRHGGTLTYASRPAGGTTATATLPAPAHRRSDGPRAGGG